MLPSTDADAVEASSERMPTILATAAWLMSCGRQRNTLKVFPIVSNGAIAPHGREAMRCMCCEISALMISLQVFIPWCNLQTLSICLLLYG